jgi:mannose-6-phosphate isomerase-like protein (cupin superfamily)
MPLKERISVIENLKMVDEAITWDDSDGSASAAIFKLRCTTQNDDSIIFANGGDRTETNTPEQKLWKDTIGVKFAFNVGGDKKTSSSVILNNWDKEFAIRDWGTWSVLKEYSNVKVKELVVKPGHSLSMQRHRHREELWFVLEGTATVGTLNISSDYDYYTVEKLRTTTIRKKQWHQLQNKQDEILRVVEFQYGDLCEEDDIERK